MDIGLIEKVQVRATKIPNSMKGLRYEPRLAKWGIKSLEVRIMRGGLIEIYKYVYELYEIN